MIEINTQENTAQAEPLALVADLLATMTARAMAAESALAKSEAAAHDWFDRYMKTKEQLEKISTEHEQLRKKLEDYMEKMQGGQSNE